MHKLQTAITFLLDLFYWLEVILLRDRSIYSVQTNFNEKSRGHRLFSYHGNQNIRVYIGHGLLRLFQSENTGN